LKTKNVKLIAWVIFLVYIAALLKLAVFRSGFLAHEVFNGGTLNFTPLVVYIKLLKAHEYMFAFWQFFGNIGWFVPLGFLLPYLTGRLQKLKMILLIGFLLSFVIELSQFVFGIGVSEVDDLILNTFGTFIGFSLYKLYNRFKLKQQNNRIT
jgi:glycopeptide antibiotics resistance protein